jgi:riboflavin kinase / FMN adenylyltransferase
LINIKEGLFKEMIKVSGKVIKGKGKGQKLGFPTVNLELKKEIESGVYKGKIEVGSNPPIGEARKYNVAIFIKDKILEAHILNFSGNLYGKKINVTIGKKLRDVMVFNNDKDLIDQIRKDISRI